jgi:Uma2 family endonuclease
VQPDFGIVLDETKVFDEGIRGVPDFLVEVLSKTSKKYDYNDKYNLYEKFGVTEYWIIDPIDKVISVYILNSDKKYIETVYDYSANSDLSINTSIIKGLEIKLKDIFKEK